VKINSVKNLSNNILRKELISKLGIDNLNYEYLMHTVYNNSNPNISIKLFKYLDLSEEEVKNVSITAVYYNSFTFLSYIIKSGIPFSVQIKIVNSLILESKTEFLSKILSLFSREEIKEMERTELFSSLSIAIIQEDLDILELLISKGFDVNKKDDKLDTPLMVSISISNIDIVSILLKNNANIDVQAEDGYTPILIALTQKDINYKLVDFLLNKGASFVEAEEIISNNDLIKIKEKLIFFN
jgi:hypothetical protein